jgi:hypothetical protein
MTQMMYLYADIIYKNEHALAVFYQKSHTNRKHRKSTLDDGEERLFIHENLNFAIIKLAASDKLFRSYFESNITEFASACCYFVCFVSILIGLLFGLIIYLWPVINFLTQ